MMSDTRRGWTLGLVVAIALLAISPVLAQNNRWAGPYQQALKAIEAGNYPQAAQLLERAVASDPKSEANKRIEGVFRIDYFPYYYLGVAYFEMQEYEKARVNLTKARSTITRPLLPKLDDYEKRTSAEIERLRAPRLNPEFERAVRAADAALAAKRFSDAVVSFDAARTADLAEFNRQNLQAKKDEATRGLRGQQLAEEGRQLLQKSQLNAARAKFQQADQALPGQASVAEGLGDIRQRQDTYQRIKAAAELDVRSNNFKAAIDKYGQARTIDPDQASADNLDGRITSVGERLKATSASAPAAVVDKGASKGPVAPPDRPVPSPNQDSAKAALRDGLAALFQGNAERSIAILEPASSGRADQNAVSLHAYLGVAYATRALSLPPEDAAAGTLREKALAEFRLAVRTQRDYQLSPRVVSPKILALFEQARSN